MASVRITLAVAGLLTLGLAWASESNAVSSHGKSAKAAQTPAKTKIASAVPAVPGAGRMQVEEPKSAAPLNSARESKAWQKNHARGLTDAQKQAFRDRKEKMEEMIAVIKEKRKAMAAAKPEERAVIARELHTLMLEKDPGTVAGTARLASDKQPAVLEDKSSAKKNGKPGAVPEANHKQGEWRRKPDADPRQGQSGEN